VFLTNKESTTKSAPQKNMGCFISSGAVFPAELPTTTGNHTATPNLKTCDPFLPKYKAGSATQCPLAGGTVIITNLTNNETTRHRPDNLAGRTLYGIGCQQNQCHAAMMEKCNLQPTTSARSKDDVLEEATEFLREYYQDCHPSGLDGLQRRLDEVTKSIRDLGYYFHTLDELTYGVKLCWRNASRCIMRSLWQNITVVDARGPNAEYARRITNKEIYDGCVKHLRSTVSEDVRGNKMINPMMTVFPQLLPGDEFGCRIWNSQLIRFAGYRTPDGSVLGDPVNVDLTDTCLALGWKSPEIRTPFDILPIVVQATDNSPPSLQELPEDAKLLVPIRHPQYPKLADLNIKWHAIPALSSFTCDIGGIQYPCSPFNGWYLDTEIACRNLCDIQRYNLLPVMAKVMGLNINGDCSELVRDRAFVEMNAAVLWSFDKERITIIDHYTASESFVRHHKKEMETRGFIPSDWIWLTPPIGGSANQVFHQEMVNFFIKTNFIMPSHTQKQLLDLSIRKGLVHFCDDEQNERPNTNTAVVERKALSESAEERCQKVYIYYGSETGVSENHAKIIKKHIDSAGSDRCKVMHFATLNECDLLKFLVPRIAETPSKKDTVSKLLMIVTSTFGAGGPPRNASTFFEQLHDGTYDEHNTDLSGTEVIIFGNGSSSYASFNRCALVIESKLRAMKASVLLTGNADERRDPEGTFRCWCDEMLALVHCDRVSLTAAGDKRPPLNNYNVLLRRESKSERPSEAITRCTLKSRTNLVNVTEREVFQFDFEPAERTQLEDGDHIAIVPRNSPENVSDILAVLDLTGKENSYVDLTTETTDGVERDTIPGFLRGMYTVGDILAEHIDLSAPPTFAFIQKVLELASLDEKDRTHLTKVTSSFDHFTRWIAEYNPSHIEFFRQFPSVACRLPLSVFLTSAPRIAARLYSVSSSSGVDKHINIAVRVEYIRSKRGDENIVRRGLCSDYLLRLKEGDNQVRLYVSPSHEFHLATDVPIVMIATGTGIAPFRGFWRTFAALANPSKSRVKADAALLYYGCRNKDEHIYGAEMTATFTDRNLAIAYSRDSSSDAKYVTELISRDAARLSEYIETRKAKVYVCGSNQMAADVRERFKALIGAAKLENLRKIRKYVEQVF
jgi:nitric oxide synthase oxygenase domain/subunit/ferredoxin-NADP reductase/flavodoxin